MTLTISSEFRWLLDRTAEWSVPVRLVLPETMDQVAQWNAPCPRWRTKDVFAALGELERLGWIRFLMYDAGGKEIPVTQPALDHQALIDAYLSRRQPLHYRLTDVGGEVWEQAARPNWMLRYVSKTQEAASEDDEGECIVTAMNEDVARRALLSTAFTHNFIVVPGSERYVRCDRWKATYWKEMESGIQAIAAIGSELQDIRVETLLPLASQRRCGENTRLLGWWYKPVEEPDWQHREYLEYGGMWK